MFPASPSASREASIAQIHAWVHALLEAMDQAFEGSDPLPEFRAWLESRPREWSLPWRVGLVGITSSGKTTLVNALLGEALLPTRVEPNTSVPTVVTHGGEPRAEVVFDQKRKGLVLVGQHLARDLAAHVTEQENPGNAKGVVEVRLEGPRFILGDTIHLIDLPGLDAQEAHERLTLDTRLYDLDLVLYLTTSETEAEQSHRGYLDKLRKAEKPVILVQNKVDLVSAHPYEAKAAAQVAGEIRDRLARVAGKVFGQGAVPPIVQVSAWNELQAPGTGNFPAFQQVLHQALDAQLGMRTSLAWLKDLGQQLDQVLGVAGAKGAAPHKAEVEVLAGILGRLDGLMEGAANLAKEKGQLCRIHTDLLADLPNVNGCDRAEAFLARMNERWEGRIADIGTLLGDARKEAESLCALAGLDARSLLSRSSFAKPTAGEVPIPSRVREVSTRVAREGWVIPKIKRTLGSMFGQSDWGYDTVVEHRVEFDASAFHVTVRGRLAQWQRWMDDCLPGILHLPVSWHEAIDGALEARREALREAKVAHLALRNSMNRFTQKARAIREAIEEASTQLAGRKSTPACDAVCSFKQDKARVEISTATLGVTMLHREYRTLQFPALREGLLRRLPPVTGEAILSAEPEEALGVDAFRRRYWPPGIGSQAPILPDGSAHPGTTAFYLAASAQASGWLGVSRLLAPLVTAPGPRPLILAVLLCNLFDHPGHFDAEGLLEGLGSLAAQAGDAGIPFSGCLLDHDEPALTLVADAFVTGSWDLAREDDRTRLQGALALVGRESRAQALFDTWGRKAMAEARSRKMP